MKILNIHAGITDDDILHFMIDNNFIEGYEEKVEKEKNEYLLKEELMKAWEGDEGFNPYFFDPNKKPELLPPEPEKEEKQSKITDLDKELSEKNGNF